MVFSQFKTSKFILIAGLSTLASAPNATAGPVTPDPDQASAAFQTSGLAPGEGAFFDGGVISAALINAKTSGTMRNNPYNGTYISYAGSGVMTVEGKDIAFSRGDVVFVKANVNHSFHTLSADALLVGLQSSMPEAASEPAYLYFDATAIHSEIRPDQDVWTPFLQSASFNLGIYLLPLVLDGDNALTHKRDEINVVVKSKADFHVGDKVVPVGPGSIVWVRKGTPHYFNNLSGDFEVFILFPALEDDQK